MVEENDYLQVKPKMYSTSFCTINMICFRWKRSFHLLEFSLGDKYWQEKTLFMKQKYDLTAALKINKIHKTEGYDLHMWSVVCTLECQRCKKKKRWRPYHGISCDRPLLITINTLGNVFVNSANLANKWLQWAFHLATQESMLFSVRLDLAFGHHREKGVMC